TSALLRALSSSFFAKKKEEIIRGRIGEMRREIEGKVYDTEKAERISLTGPTIATRQSSDQDFNKEVAEIYVTPKGNWFIAGWGGAATRFGQSCGNGRCDGYKIIRLDKDQALKELEDAGVDAQIISRH